MIAKYEKVKSLIFDGPEPEILHRSFGRDAGINIVPAIQFNDFAKNEFEDLQGIINEADFDAIVQTGGFKPDGGFLNLYKGSRDLRLYFCKRGNVVLVFAYGEFQPARYMLYLEGIWTLA
jgi:hypothetical protein